ncbi:protein kinase, AMP-activated, alpha 2 catalytic subunit, partial [Nowakowskiella sp. JEL0078]
MVAYGFDPNLVENQILGSKGKGPPFSLYHLLKEQDEKEKKEGNKNIPKLKDGAIIVEKFAGDGGASVLDYEEINENQEKDKSKIAGIGVGEYILEDADLDLVPEVYTTSGVSKKVEKKQMSKSVDSEEKKPPTSTIATPPSTLKPAAPIRRLSSNKLKEVENGINGSECTQPEQSNNSLSQTKAVTSLAPPVQRGRVVNDTVLTSSGFISNGLNSRQVSVNSNLTISHTNGSPSRPYSKSSLPRKSDNSIEHPDSAVIVKETKSTPNHVNRSGRDRSISSPAQFTPDSKQSLLAAEKPSLVKELSNSNLKLPQVNNSRQSSIVSMHYDDDALETEYTPQTIEQAIMKKEVTTRSSISTRDEKKSSFTEAFKNTFKKMSKTPKYTKKTISHNNSNSSVQLEDVSTTSLAGPLLTPTLRARPNGSVRARPMSYHAGQKVSLDMPPELANILGITNDKHSNADLLPGSNQNIHTLRNKSQTFKNDMIPEPQNSLGLLSAETTSTLQPDQIVIEIERVMQLNGLKTIWTGYKVQCELNDIEFEIELCRVKGTNMVGLELRRTRGSTWVYQA